MTIIGKTIALLLEGLSQALQDAVAAGEIDEATAQIVLRRFLVATSDAARNQATVPAA